MKTQRITIIYSILLLLTSFQISAETVESKRQISGNVTDENTHEPISGATIYFPEIKVGTLTDENGNYLVQNLPGSQLTMQISMIGYQSTTQMIDLRKVSQLNFELKESVTEISEIVITGQPGLIEQKRTPAPIVIVPHASLLENSSTNIIDALAKLPGISQITTGAGISKPVIRGLGYNRVVVVNNGIRQEGQQWGDEHGIEIDEFDISHIEVLKGPASLAFGSDAMAGVINMLSYPTLPNGKVKGNVITNFQTNNGLFGYSANLAGNQSGFVWDARFSGKLAHDYENKYDGPVFNSRFRENALSTLLGLNRSWGFSHLTLSMYHLEPGIIEGERDENGNFLKITEGPNGEETEAPAATSDFDSYQADAPFQKISHYKAVWNNKVYFGKGNLETTFGFQQNNRKEFESADEYGLYFKLNTVNYDLKYILQTEDNWTITSGVGGMWQQSKNEGSEFLVPAYSLLDAGVFAIVRKQMGDFDLSGGLRFDRRHQDAEALFLNDEEVTTASDPDGEERFSAFEKTFNGFSGSMGASYQISDEAYTKLNISRGYRAPNIAELGSNGEHEGTFSYEIGNTELKPETSLQIDWGIGLDTKHVSAEMNLFNNQIDHFIYSHKLTSSAGADSLIDEVPVFKFAGGKAHLYGGEIRLDIHPHPLDFIHFENSFSYVRGTLSNQPEASKNLPLIPAANWQSELKFDIPKVTNWAQNTFIRFGIDHNWKQDHFYAAFNTETATAAYTLLNAGIGADFTSNKRTICTIYIIGNNLTNKAYQNHLSRLKYAGENEATGRTGVFNMGRNFSFKLLIPIYFTATKARH